MVQCCDNPNIQLEECDEHGTEVDSYICISCHAVFEHPCTFTTGDNPFKTPIQSLQRVA